MASDSARTAWFTSGDAPFGPLTWRELGPWRGGRVQAVTGHPTDPDLFYFGSTGGGVWRSDDAGANWRNISDGSFRSGPVGAIAVSDADPDVMYVGTGEGSLRSNVTGGDGVYRSRDGGVTWAHVGLAATQNIARIRIDPRDPDRVFVAATGHRFGPNEERGIFRSTDGGASWERTLFVDADTGAADLSLDPANPRFLYAATWRAGRTPWGFTAGGPGSGLWRSTDGGTSWASLADAPGMPRGPIGRIAVAVSPADSRRVYALIEAEGQGGLYRSSDRGLSWTWVSAAPNLLVRPWYLAHLVADPLDPDTVYIPNRKLWKSRDGGRSWQQLNTTYWDQHDLWLDPREPHRMILGNDGGAAVSRDSGTTWSTILNQPTAELYHVATDTRFPYRVYGAQQDNSTISLPTRSVNGPISQADWFDVGGGESGHIAVRPDRPDIVYAASYGGEVTRYDHATGDLRTIAVWPEESGGWGARDLRHRFNWSTPVVLSPHDPDTLYIAGERVFRSRDEGATWATISPDLTRNDPTKGGRAGGPITFDSSASDYYCTIMAFVESPVRAGILWAGSDDGLVHLSRDAGDSWTNVTPPGVPEWASVAAIETSPQDAAMAYVAVTAHHLDDFAPYLFRTTDWGATWTPIVAGLPPARFLRTIRADPARRGLLYAAGEGGVWVSFDDGAGWASFQQNLPITPIYDLVVRDGDLIAATHGRGFWVLDDLTPLHAAPPAPAPHLFPPRPVVRVAREAYNITSLIALGYPHGAAGPDFGVWFHYLLPEGFADEVTLTIFDPLGLPIRTFSSVTTPVTDVPLGPYAHRLRGSAAMLATRGRDESEPGVRTGVLPPEMQARPEDGSRPPKNAGLNRFVWDLRYPEAETLPGQNPGGITAPLAPPGIYRVRLTVAGRQIEQGVTILPDPRLETTTEGYLAQFTLLLGLRDQITRIHRAVGMLRDLRAQTRDRVARLGGDAPARANARAICTGFLAALDEREGALLQPRINDRAREQEGLDAPVGLDVKLAGLGYFVAKSDRAPTAAQVAVYDDLAARTEVAVVAARGLLAAPLAALDVALLVAGLPALAR